MTNPTSNPQVIGAPYTVSQYHQHVAICDKRGYAVAEIAYGTGGMPDVYRALEYACAWRDRLNATPDETSRDADDAGRYRYLKTHLGSGWGVKLAGADPYGFAGPTLLDQALDAARDSIDSYGCTGCRSTPCICSQLEPEAECAHTLVMPESTLTVIDPFKAKCRVCYEFFDLPLGGTPSSVNGSRDE